MMRIAIVFLSIILSNSIFADNVAITVNNNTCSSTLNLYLSDSEGGTYAKQADDGGSEDCAQGDTCKFYVPENSWVKVEVGDGVYSSSKIGPVDRDGAISCAGSFWCFGFQCTY